MTGRPIFPRRAAASLLATAATALAGCGAGAGEQAGGVHLRVTDDFGARTVTEPGSPKQSGADTVMRLLQRNAKVGTRYGGGFVQSIDGLSGKTRADAQVDWFYYVNGLLAGRGAADWRVRDGERIWWDRHRWELAQVSAVVGDFPQPMKDGSDGEWAGAQLDCRAASATCDVAKSRLEDAGVTVTVGPASTAGARTRVIVGPWRAIRGAAREVRMLAGGPAVSGVFAKVDGRGNVVGDDASGDALPDLDAGGEAIVRNPPTGLVAAVRIGDASPVWVITGPDDSAAAAAARALTADVLAARFAVLVRDDRALALPLRAGDEGRKVGS